MYLYFDNFYQKIIEINLKDSLFSTDILVAICAKGKDPLINLAKQNGQPLSWIYVQGKLCTAELKSKLLEHAFSYIKKNS